MTEIILPEDLQPGHIVYEPYSPGIFGKVIERLTDNSLGWEEVSYRVRWKTGKEEVVSWTAVNSLENLIADHEKKLNTHKANLAKAREL